MIIEQRFNAVADTFFALTADQPFGGAALSVYHHGVPVIDIWAGEMRPAQPWRADTQSLIFSTSKGLLSILAHRLIEQGLLNPDEKVAHYWPEFAQAGKENITVAMIMRHRSGLSAVREDLTFEDLQKVVPVEEALARQEPIWEPDTGFHYHAGTIGHLLGKIIFNITGKRVNEFLQQEIAQPLGVEAYFGTPPELESRITELRSDVAPETPEPEFESPLYWSRRSMSYGKAFSPRVDDFQYGFNDPRTHQMEFAGAGGISNARSIAKIYSSLVTKTDGVQLLSDQTVMKALSRPNIGSNIFNEPDPHAVHSLGFIVANPEHSPVLSQTTFGHDGLGGQQGFADIENSIGFGYVTNWIPLTANGMARHREITRILQTALK